MPFVWKPKFICVFFVCFAIAYQTSFAQKAGGKNRYSRSKLGYKSPKVRGQKAKIVCPVFETTGYPYHGLGVKLGDPAALTYKYYPNGKFSVAADFGKASSGLYNRYFREKFLEYAAMGDTLSDNSSLTYSFHRLKADWVADLKFLYHVEASALSEGIQLYTGLGWEWKYSRIAYDFHYNRAGINAVREPRQTERTRSTMGPQVVMGLEYSNFKLPVSAFMEVEYFLDVKADPGWKKFEGGVGLRYIF